MIPNRSWKEAQEGKTAGGEVMKRNQIGPGGQPVRPGDTVVASVGVGREVAREQA